MSKEVLKALHEWEWISDKLADWNGTDISELDKEYNYSNNIIKVREALTPPTEQQVCEALSEYLKKPVKYDTRFGFACNDKIIICLYPNNVLWFDNNYPATIHEIVGKFYKGMKE